MPPSRALLALVAFCSALVATRAVAPNGNCELLFGGKPVLSSDWEGFCNVSAYAGNLKDTTLPGVEFAVFTSENVASFTYDSSSSYVDVVLDSAANTLSLVITDQFPNYEEDMIAASLPSEININTELTCGDGNLQTLKFKITVEDVNTHAPEFESASYEYDLPMPFPSEIDLSCLEDVINVKDIDFSNSAITIQISDDGDKLFRAEATYQGSRNYAVKLYSKTAIELKQTTTFTLTAQDNGTPDKLTSAPVTLTINVDEQTSPPTAPRFELALLHKKISTDDIVAGTEIASLTISEGYAEDIKVDFITEDDGGLTPPSSAFVLGSPVGTGSTATISLSWAEDVTTMAIQDFKYALITVTATRDRALFERQVASTVIHLSLPGMEEQIPTTTACPTTVEPTECPPCPTTEPCSTTEPCPTTEPCEPCSCTTSGPTTTAEPCPTTEPCEPCSCTTAGPTTTAETCPSPEPCEPCSSTAEPTQCPSQEPCPTTCDTEQSSTSTTPVSSTDPTWCPTTPCPDCNCSATTEPCNCPSSTEGPPVETTSPGSTTDCSHCPVTDCPPTTPSSDSSTASNECPTVCPACTPTTNTGSTTDCSQCPATDCPPTTPSSDSSTTSNECPTICPTWPPITNTGSTTDCSQCPATDCPPTTPSSDSSTACNECPDICPTSSPTSPNTGSGSDCPISCDDCPTAAPTPTTTALPPGPPIEFEEARYSLNVPSGFAGHLLDLTLKEYDSEDYSLVCELDATGNVASSVSVNAEGATTCQLTLDVFLPAGSHSFGVLASLEGTSSTATAEVALGVQATVPCNDSVTNVYAFALLVSDQPEAQKEPITILIPEETDDAGLCSYTHTVDPAAHSDWVQVDTKTGELKVTDMDYESVTSLVITLSAQCAAEQQRLWRAPRDLSTEGQPQWPRNLTFDVTQMTVLVRIQDINDNAPKFTIGDRRVLAYPTGDLLERVQPGPVVTLTATDADEGENADLRYSLDSAGDLYFTVEPKTGAVYPRTDAPGLPDDGASITAIVKDLDGANEALRDTVTLQVMPLEREELVLMTTVDGVLPEEADDVVATLSEATSLAVRLLRAYPAVSEGARSARAMKARADSPATALTLLLYALDDEDRLVTVDQFQQLLSSSAGSLPWTSKVEQLPPEPEEQEPTDVTGYVAGIIVLAVLVVLAAVGVGAGYYFYFRPRMGAAHKQKDGYTEFPSDSDKSSPLESQIPQIITTVEPNISTISEIIEPEKQQTAENNIQTHADSVGVLAPSSEEDWSRKRSMTIRGGPDDYNDTEAPGGSRRSESSDSIDGDEAQAEAERRKSTVHFNENVECIEVDRL